MSTKLLVATSLLIVLFAGSMPASADVSAGACFFGLCPGGGVRGGVAPNAWACVNIVACVTVPPQPTTLPAAVPLNPLGPGCVINQNSVGGVPLPGSGVVQVCV